MFVTRKKYDAVARDRDVCRANYDEMNALLLDKVDELRTERETVGRFLKEKMAMGERAKELQEQLAAARAEIEALQPDADHWRNKLRRDRERKTAQRQNLAGIQQSAREGL